MVTLAGPSASVKPAAGHHVRIGHTTQVPRSAPCPSAVCACHWHAEGDHVRGDAVEHAAAAGHCVLVADGRTRTWVEVTS